MCRQTFSRLTNNGCWIGLVHMIPKLLLPGSLRWATLLICTALSARAEVKLHGLFSDNMVLQQGASVPVWGWADDGEIVTVQFRGQTVKTKTKDGKWMVRLKKLKAGGPEELTVSGKNQ